MITVQEIHRQNRGEVVIVLLSPHILSQQQAEIFTQNCFRVVEVSNTFDIELYLYDLNDNSVFNIVKTLYEQLYQITLHVKWYDSLHNLYEEMTISGNLKKPMPTVVNLDWSSKEFRHIKMVISEAELSVIRKS